MKIMWRLSFPCGKCIIFEDGNKKNYIVLSFGDWLKDAPGIDCPTIYKYRYMKMPFRTYEKRYLR